jgi:hypothetical protein
MFRSNRRRSQGPELTGARHALVVRTESLSYRLSCCISGGWTIVLATLIVPAATAQLGWSFLGWEQINGEQISIKTEAYSQMKPIAKADLVLALVSTAFAEEDVASAVNGIPSSELIWRQVIRCISMIIHWLLHSSLPSADHKVKLGHLTITFTATVIGPQQFVLTPPSSHKIVNIPAASMKAVRSYPFIAIGSPRLRWWVSFCVAIF